VRVLLTARAEEGCSPKIHKLIIGAAEAQGEVIVVLDDDTILPVGGLAQTTRELAESRVGLVFGLPYYGCFLNIWSSMLAAFVNAHSLLTYIPPSFFIPPFTINGMFYGCRREALESVGGFDTLRHGLCDDFTVAQLFIKAGWTLKQMSLRHEIRTFVRDRAHYMGVMRRWLVFPQVSIMRQLSCRDLVWFHGLIMLPTVLPLLIVLVGVFCGTMSGLVLVAAFLVVDTLLAACINRLWLFQITPRWRLPLLALSRVLLPIHFALSMTGKRQINWRGHVMNVTADGRFRIVQRR
jgi:ceramide glucosyltransferase